MPLALLFSDPGFLFVWVAVILISITVHEFSHALAANQLGDKTAELAGRLTLNPIKHIDPLGLILLFVLGFGWAKPVPFNPYNLKDPKMGSVFIALAGPASNLILATVSGLLLRALVVGGAIEVTNMLAVFLALMVLINLFLLFFNIVPLHPLDGSKLLDAILSRPHQLKLRNAIAIYGPRVLMVLVILSLLTNWDVFFFVRIPSLYLCDVLTGGNCFGF